MTMNDWRDSLLVISLLLNTAIGTLAAYWLHRRGGLQRFSVKTINSIPPGAAVSIRRTLYRTFNGDSTVTHDPTVMFGDSLIAGGLWAEWYGPNVLNRGIGGETTADALLRSFDIAALHPAKIFIMLGTNDYKAALAPETTIDNMRKVIADLRAASPASEIYLQSILPPWSLKRESWTTQVNAMLEVIAEENQVYWIDLCPRFAAGRFIDPRLTWDGVHLTPAGYQIWREVLEPYIVEEKR